MLGCGWFPDQLGGLNRYYRELLEHLPQARGVVIAGDASTPARVAGVSGHGRPLPLRLLAFWRAAQREAAAVDVVDAHFALYALLPLRLGKLRRTPVVLHFHGPWAQENVSAGDESRLKLRVRVALERAAYRRADQAVVLTSAFRQVLVEGYGIQPWIVNVQPPGVDLERFAPGSQELARDALGLSRDAFVAVAVRRLVPRMGLELLLDVWHESLEQLPAGSTLLIAGEGQLEQELSRIAASDGSASIRLLGRVSDERLVTLYRAADLAIVPSLEHEGFGLVVLEAAACGTPSIVSSVGGLPEAAGGLDPSLIVPPGDRVALRDRLLRSVVDRPERAATRAYAERYNWEGVAARHREIAMRAISRVHAGGRAAESDARPLKVVYLDHVARMSGGEIALLRLLPHLDRVDPHLILAEDGPLVGQMHLAGVSTEVLPFADSARDMHRDEVRGSGVPANVAAATAAYVLKLAWRLRRLQPDLVHANSLKSGVYGSLAARLAGIPMVWHVRDRIADDYLPHPAVILIRRMTRHLPAAVVANSQSTMATLGAPRNSTTIYQVLPDVLGSPPARERVSGGPLTYGVVGRLAPWKGQDLFLRAFARAFPASEERGVLVGGALFGEDDYASELPRLAEQLGIADRIELRGHRTDIWSELARLDVLVHTSVTPEPFGQVILEGMAAGVPVIAAGAGGAAEILRHGETGVLYRPSDAAELANAMVRMQDRGLREQLSATARNSLEPYAPPFVAEQLQRLYSNVLEQSLRRV
jgi:glycosyltransferase involved in cell wall biosynthesis